MIQNYKIPPMTRIGHVHLRVSDIEKALKFYQNILGFEITERMGEDAVFLSAGGYHHHIGLNTWNSKGAAKAPKDGVGLFHAAILFEKRRDLAEVLQRLLNENYPITGGADHGVSEAIYLDDPDGNGIELYWDKPRNEWPIKENGGIKMFTLRLDLEELLGILD